MHQVRYAHCEGYTDICYTDKNKYMTTGEDGDVRIWQGFDDTDNASIRIGDKCSAIAYKNGKIYVADDLNELKKYDLETNEFQGVLTSFTLPITTICVNKSETQLVCGSSDFEIHLIELKSLKSTLFTGHDAPILHACFDPLEKYFVSSSCDGTAKFWSLQTLNAVKTLSNLHKKSNDFIDSQSLCKIAWHKDGGLIAVPCEKEVHFYERETWLLKFKINLNTENSSDEFVASICCFSPDGRYILVATNTQMVYIHSIITKSMVFKYSYSKKARICSLVWNPDNQNEIIFCDVNGFMGLIKPVIKDEMNCEASQEVLEKPSTKNNKKSKPKNDDDNLEMDDLLNLIDTDEKSNDSNASEVIKKPKSSKKNELKSPNKKRKRLSDDNDEEMCTNIEEEIEIDEMDGEDDMESLEKLKEKTYKSVKKDILMMDDDETDDMKHSEHMTQESRKPINHLQPAFQASSTPLTLHERYMVWNTVGLITQYIKEGDESIDIEFHNATYHHTIHIKNQFGYTMADMSKEAVIMGSPGKITDDDAEINSTILSSITNHSKLACILINSCDNNKEWTIDMPRKEYIKCLCVSKNLVACMTSRRFLRIYGLAGTQKEIICFNGSPICMRAYDNTVFICYGSQESPTLHYSIYYIDDENSEAEHGILPISEDAKLEWLGFSDEGSPFYYDSNGYLYTRCATVSKNKAWTPYSDLRFELKHKSDNHWLIGIAERNQMIKTILCRAAKYPQVLPRPTLSMVNINIPLCEADSEKTKLEKDYWKNKISSLNMRNYDCSNENLDLDQEEVDEKIDSFESGSREILMKLFMFSCKNNREQRAFEVAGIMDTNALQLAIKYATKTRALVLAQNLNVLAEKKAISEYEKERKRLEQEEKETRNYYTSDRRAQSNDYMETQETVKPTESNQNNDIIFESETQLDSTTSGTIKSTLNTQSVSGTLDDSLKSCATPTSIPLTTTRLNPFKSSNSALKTPLNDSSKSIINELEEKINKQSATKEKDQWKPTPPRKLLTKNKVTTTPTSSINSFFSKN